MSRLDTMIARLQAQRACIDLAAECLQTLPGVILELGLGSGRTFDHLRTRFPQREIYVFDNRLDAHPSCVPEHSHLFLGDVRKTLQQAVDRWSNSAALIHADLGSHDASQNSELANAISPMLGKLLNDGGLLLTNRAEMAAPHWRCLALPEGVQPNHVYMFRA